MRLPRTQIVTLANQKGGCGKTTGSVSLAAAFALEGTPSPWSMPTLSAMRPTHSGLIRIRSSGWPVHPGGCLSTKKAAREIEYPFPEERFEGRLTLIPGTAA